MMQEFKLTISSLGYLIQELTKLVTANQKIAYRVSIKQWRESRSLSQNALYWKWLAEIDKQSPLKIEGNTVKGSELWHEVFKKYYCPVKNVTNSEKSLPVQSTKVLDIGEMTFYLNKIENFCIDRGIRLTIPESCDYSKYMEQQND